jgi:hypothetical protein
MARLLLRGGTWHGAPARKRRTPLRSLVLLPAMVTALVGLSSGLAAAAETATSTVPLLRLVLRGSQVGPGYRLTFRPDSRGVRNLVTLDMCGFLFRSEELRTARLQVNYTKPREPVKVSNELVTYRLGGAALAMREVDEAVAHCPRTPVISTIAGVGPLTYRIARFTASGLLPGAIALRVHATGKVQGHKTSTTVVAIYQTHADTLSGVYVYDGSLAARIRIGIHAGRQSAKNLRSS